MQTAKMNGAAAPVRDAYSETRDVQRHAWPAVSIVVATKDRPEDLRRCLDSILEQRYEGFVEVIVVDQSSEPASAPQTSSGEHPVRHLHDAVPGKARALNRAMTVARGNVLLLTDDDCTVGAGWLESMATHFEVDAGLSLVFGPVVAAPHDTASYYVPMFEPRHERLLTGWTGRLAVLGLGANMAVRKTVVESLGGWDEHIGPGSKFRSGDDHDLAYRCLAAGGTVLVATRPAVTHYGMRPYNDGSVRRLHRNNYFGLGATLTKHVRCRDPYALYKLARCFAGALADMTGAFVKHRRLTGGGRTVALLQGVRSAMMQPIDRSTRRFVSR